MKLKLQLAGRVDDPAQISDVARIVGGVADGWHNWAAPDPADEDLEPYYAHNPTHRELLTKSYTSTQAYGRLDARTVTIVVHGPVPTDADAWPLQAAVAYLAQPLEVLVENARNDGDFFLACWRALGHQVAKVFLAPRPAAHFGQGGGKAEALKLLVHRFKDAQARGAVPPRIFVLVDSDTEYPGHETRETRSLITECASLRIPCVVLRKRSIENYVGDAALNDLATNYPDILPSVGFLLGLNEHQRDHYPIKKGLHVENGQPVLTSDGARELYARVTWPPGLRPKLGRLMEHVLDDSALITLTDLASRNAVDELTALAGRLEKEI